MIRMISFGNKAKILKIIALTALFIFPNISKSLENKIEYKINNEIITTLDIKNEISYFKAFNKNFQNLDNQSAQKIIKKSLIKEKIKKLEILKFVNKIENNENYYKDLIEKTYKKMGIKTYDEFLDYLESYNLNVKIIQNKILIDIFWKQLIFQKYNDKIQIDENKLKDQLSNNNNKIKSYFLSEIFFNAANNDELIKKTQEIEHSISNIGFRKTVLIYSKSESSKDEGKVGWISENSLNKKIRDKLNIMKTGESTNPIVMPGGFLILKIGDIKYENKKINLDKELKKLVYNEKNKQLEQYSNIYFNKIKKNYQINEL